MKILAFGASTSSSSINRQLANHAASLIPGASVTQLNLRDYSLPIYSSDEEETNGIPADAHAFLAAIREHDAIVVSLAEHNGSYAAAFKNLYDWTSRIETKLWSDKPMLLMASSPGGRGGASVLEAAKATFPRMGADLKASFSLPSFYDNYSAEEGISDAALDAELKAAVAKMAP
jgi:NAD(P)H-dependent FMN reductase